MTPQDPGPVLDLIEAFRRSKAMFTAVKLGVFDQLETRARTAEEFAASNHLHPQAVARLLDGCVSLGLLAGESGSYRNTPLSSRYLVSTSPHSLAGYILYSDDSLYLLWSHLEDAVREGTDRWAQTFGRKQSIFEQFFHDERSAARFLAGMHGMGMISSTRIASAFDFTRFGSMVDLGGATGHLAAAICRKTPAMTAMVFDLPLVEPFARQYLEGADISARIRFVAGDFFRDTLPAADLYAMGRILHDWNDERIHLLLRKIFQALPKGGALLIAESLIDEDRSGPAHTFMQDLNMLVCTEGRERTLSEYTVLLERSGFSGVESRRTGPPLDAVLAWKR
jgi:acetylserotonin N-methyltransferase